jgi:hypothetical protein
MTPIMPGSSFRSMAKVAGEFVQPAGRVAGAIRMRHGGHLESDARVTAVADDGTDVAAARRAEPQAFGFEAIAGDGFHKMEWKG